ncbi:alpha/beta hydrolase [Bacillus sp. CH30_1T]|uniref:alpha/beta hydrolase n=1 Tax=Bacillus sp. CH30_1T TaxID=2604836 RepID=UPI0011EEBAC5|nr:alpha/beta hydrolase-fold protein [Bacillus sp. CH30_1T]KAA0563537.1 alpha/beta hydrolase [Bacillus sp. CH30_1T]
MKAENRQPFTIAGATQHTMISNQGHPYRILISAPQEEPPSEGFPIIYLLDGNAIFATVVEAMRIQSRKPEKTGVYPAIIVGIGYETEAPFSSRRFTDYTMGNPEIDLPEQPDGSPWPEHGGAEVFASFIEEELKPELDYSYPVDKNNQAIFGHSLGGLYVLNSLFTRPASFKTYIAGSPSIHWNNEIIYQKEKMFLQQSESENISANLLIGLGEHEQWHHTNMGDLAKEMADRLQSCQGLNVTFIEFAGEGHVSVLPPLISKSLPFIFSANG